MSDQIKGPASPTKEEWAKMTGPERAALQAARKAAALALIEQTGSATGLVVTLAGQRVVARPTGVSPNGNITYGVPRGHEVAFTSKEGVMQKVRINTPISLTVMASNAAFDVEPENDRLL